MAGHPIVPSPPRSRARQRGLHVHPALLRMARVVHEEQSDLRGMDVAGVVQRLTIQLPSLAEVHKAYDAHFADISSRGDKRAEAKKHSFFAAIHKDLESVGPDRTLVVDQPFVEI